MIDLEPQNSVCLVFIKKFWIVVSWMDSYFQHLKDHLRLYLDGLNDQAGIVDCFVHFWFLWDDGADDHCCVVRKWS